jgi:putative two-component system response regulator
MTSAKKTTASIMIVDDTPANLKLLEGMLREQGYSTRPCPRGRLALRAAESEPPDLILLDINMPEMNGYEVCEQLKANEKLADIPVIFISALNETMDKIKAFAVGGVDYVTKPFQFEEVQARVETHLELRRNRLELKRHNHNLEELVQEQVEQILRGKESLSDAQLATILAMSKIAEARDDDTGKHIERTQSYCRALAVKLRDQDGLQAVINDDFIDNLFHASPLHDIGKVAIPDAILCKPGKLTDEEFEIMKTHAAMGAETLRSVSAKYPNNAFINMGIEIAQSHHEKWSGAGYPDGLAGGDIPLSARIMAIADVYDALRSVRCYKEAFSHEKSRDIIVSDSGMHFDPTGVEAFLAIEDEFSKINERLQDR